MSEETLEMRSGKDMIKQYEGIQELASKLADALIQLFGANPGGGRIEYNRNLSLERLEECMHRVSDGMHYLVQTSVEAQETAAKMAMSKPGLSVVEGGN
jgi:hypothetical protein